MKLSRSFKRFLVCQVALYASLVVCAILRPESLTINDGISYFGNFGNTIVPYALGLILAATFSVAAGRALPTTYPANTVRHYLYLFALGAIGILATPSLSARWISLTHEWIGASLFFLQLVLCIWIVLYIKRDVLNIVLLLIEITCALAAAFYLNPPTGLLMQSQFFFQVTFGLIMLWSWPEIESSVRVPSADGWKNMGQEHTPPEAPATPKS